MMRHKNNHCPISVAGIVLAGGLFLWIMSQSTQIETTPQTNPSPPKVVTGFFSDVRISVPATLHQQLVDFIKTGKLSSGKFGVDTTAVQSIECKPGLLTFRPPVRVTYTGGLLRGGTTVKEIRIDADGQILVDVVNSPIDVIIEGDDK